MIRTSASYGKKAHEKLKEKKLVEAEIEYESSFSSYSSVSLLHPHTSPTHATYTNNTRFFKHKPKIPTSSSSSSSTWERFKSLCVASLPLMDSSSLLESKKNKYITNTAPHTEKRDELEREVSVLNKMLAHEQKVHEYLERIHDRKDGSALTIPNFLPPKMKETLAELAMVENEITRLESQIKHLQHQVKREKEDNIEKKYKEWGRAAPPKPHHEPPPHPNKRTNDHKAAFDTKALHFINKAINGDFHNSKAPPNPRRAALLKHPSPLREPRNPTPRRDRVYDVPPDYPTRVASTPLHTEEESIHRLTPNKLSESIMKCLIFIYMRLLRTSRVMELEKSGSIARSTNFSLSFRAENNSNSKTGLTLHKDSRQQDPYGIFNSEASVPRDIGPYKNLVRFTSSSMDLKCIQNSSSVPLFQKLK